MAANFWASSHSKQLLDPEEVYVVPAADRERGIMTEEFRLVKIHMSSHIWRLAQQVKVRQRVIATAITYFRRVYTSLLQDAGVTDLTQFAWGLVNDTYKMDLILIQPPYMIALACIYIASVFKDKDTTSCFEELHVDMNIVKNISMEILDFYKTYKVDPQRGLSDEKISPVMNKLPAKA